MPILIMQSIQVPLRTEPNRLRLSRIELKMAWSAPTRHVRRTTGKSISHAGDVLWSTAVVHLWIVSIEVWPHLMLISNIDNVLCTPQIRLVPARIPAGRYNPPHSRECTDCYR